MRDDTGLRHVFGETLPVRPGAADQVSIVAITRAHAARVLAIYQAGIDEGNATFETRAPGWAEFSAARLPEHRYVALEAGGGVLAGGTTPGTPPAVLGWVAVSATSSRCAYAGVVEHSVYVHPAARGRGVGRLLLARPIASTEAAGIWTIQSGIFPENTASAELHRAAGFRVVGRRDAFIASQAHRAMGVSVGDVGDLAAIFPLMYVVLALPFGKWLDVRRRGRLPAAGRQPRRVVLLLIVQVMIGNPYTSLGVLAAAAVGGLALSTRLPAHVGAAASRGSPR